MRMGTDCPKPFLKVAGKPILAHTISRFLGIEGVIQILISSSPAYMGEIQEIISNFDRKISFRVVEGGSERQLSIYNALQYVSEESELIAVHDAVRPFIRVSQIEKCNEVAHKFGGAVVGIPAKDTIKKVDEGAMVTETPDRSFLWQAQTPQIFQKKLLLKAYDSAQKNKFIGTDDASLVERIGGKVKMVQGDQDNIKITYPIDLKIAEMMLENTDE